MIHAYHVIMPMYGFWLPNDPRGSWSDFVRSWELVAYGKASPSTDRQVLTLQEQEKRLAAKACLSYPPVTLNGPQAQQIGMAFAEKSQACNYTIWACAILPEHTHLVVARHSYQVERIVNTLKGASTQRLVEHGMHPLSKYSDASRPPRMWASRLWKTYLDDEHAIEQAIHYVEQNPIKEGKPRQVWSVVTPFCGIPQGSWTTYH